MIIDSSIDDLEFQSTPSVGRATKDKAMDKNQVSISIHALRGEGDELLRQRGFL